MTKLRSNFIKIRENLGGVLLRG